MRFGGEDGRGANRQDTKKAGEEVAVIGSVVNGQQLMERDEAEGHPHLPASDY
jgi:hypothetical protein